MRINSAIFATQMLVTQLSNRVAIILASKFSFIVSEFATESLKFVLRGMCRSCISQQMLIKKECFFCKGVVQSVCDSASGEQLSFK